MKVSIGSDHRGIALRAAIAEGVKECGHEVVDHGTFSEDSVDYPDIVVPVVQCVVDGNAERAILICGTGIGVSIAANKLRGIRAAVCHDVRTAKLSRNHNDANVLCMPADTLDGDGLKALVKVWLTEEFEGGRHARRVDKISAIENSEPVS